MVPPSLEGAEGHLTLLEVGLVHVGDHDLPSAGEFQMPVDVNNLRIVEIDADEGEVGLGGLGQPLGPHHLAVLHLGRTKAGGVFSGLSMIQAP